MVSLVRDRSDDMRISGRRFSVAPVLAIVIGAACLLVPALINGFPFLYPDSADYLRSFRPPTFRSPFYGLFIYFFHFNRFVWGPIVAQALIVSHLVWVLVKIYAREYWERCFALSILILCLFSSLPFFVDLVMPDIFTGVLILVFYLLSFHRSALSKLETLYFLLTCMRRGVGSYLSPAAGSCVRGICRYPASTPGTVAQMYTAGDGDPGRAARAFSVRNSTVQYRDPSCVCALSIGRDLRAGQPDRARSSQALSS